MLRQKEKTAGKLVRHTIEILFGPSLQLTLFYYN